LKEAAFATDTALMGIESTGVPRVGLGLQRRESDFGPAEAMGEGKSSLRVS